MRKSTWIRQIAFVMAFSIALLAQRASDATPQTPQTTTQTHPTAASDELAQMRQDLDRMDSLNTNMSAETEFLRDQNLQILLRTNSQMWTILIRDLRRQIDREEQRQGKR